MTLLGDKAVGDVVKINVNGTARDFIIVHKGLPSDMYDASCNGVWLLMKDIYETRTWDSSDNDYKNSDIHTYLNDTFFNLFDADIKSSIKQVKIPYHNGTGNSGSIASGFNGLSTKIFLLGVYEIGWTQSEYKFCPIDGAKLSYFLSGNDPSAKDKRLANYNGHATQWWLRSPRNDDTYSVCTVYTSGGGYSNRYDSDPSIDRYDDPVGVRPALILPTDLLMDSDGNVSTNNTPTITSTAASGSDMGEISAPFDFTYAVNDADGDTVTVTEYLDDVQTRTYTAAVGSENTFEAVSDPVQFQKILNGQHALKIVANDGKDDSKPYTVTFDKQVKTAVITLENPLPADDVIKAAVVFFTGKIPYDATVEVLITNNANDENPVWEDMSREVEQATNHVFANRTAVNGFAFNFKVTVTRGESEEQGFIEKIGGAFE